MTITYNDIMAMGFRIGTDIKQTTIELALEAALLYYVQPSMEAADFDALMDLQDTDVLVKGGKTTGTPPHYVAGLKKGLGYIAYAELLRMNINATTFGSVQKSDEFSTNVDPSEQIRYFLTIGLQYVREVVKILGYRWHAVTGVARETYYTRKGERHHGTF